MTSEADRYARLCAIFEAARGLDVAERPAFVEAECGSDLELRRQAEQLVLSLESEYPHALSDAGIATRRGDLEALVTEAASTLSQAEGDAHWLPEKIGTYQIERYIGAGGMGVVYEAVQESTRRSVAIKLLHPQQTTPERLRRFRQEAELLARLRHPGIAQIFEAGTFDLGRGEQPFFAMELIDGVDIRLYADREELIAGARLALVAQVADAVQHAHERGVIHRDLKPENILVDPRGRPVVLDFGIARASEATGAPARTRTEEGVLLGTLAYMAPEQLAGDSESITPRADVYALGVLAYELLTGRTPHEISGLSLPAALKVLGEEHPRRLGALVPALRGDVETLISTALSRESERRYTSASAFSSDIRRYLDRLPIAARPTSRLYRVRKYAQRHRLLVSAAGALGVAIIVAGVFAMRAVQSRSAAATTTSYLRDAVEELAEPFPASTRFLKRTANGPQTLLPGASLMDGDRILLDVHSLQDINLYVFNQDDTGLVSQVFPIVGLNRQNPLAANEAYRLPGHLGPIEVAWTVDRPGGTERMLLLALPIGTEFGREAWGLEAVVQAPRSVAASSDDPRGIRPDAEIALARPLGTHPLSAFEVFRKRLKEFGGGWVRVVEFSSE